MPKFYLLRMLIALTLTFSDAPAQAQHALKNSAFPSSTVVNFVRTATGIYDNQKVLDSCAAHQIDVGKIRRQIILCYPIWEDLKEEHWLYFGWFSPQDKVNAIEEMFIRVVDNEDAMPIAEWYQLPAKAKKDDACEWLKAKPFDNIVPAEVRTEENFFAVCDIIPQGTGFSLKARENGVYSLNSQYACKAMLIDMHFNPDYYSSGSTFYDEERAVLIEHSHQFPLMKISKKYKKF